MSKITKQRKVRRKLRVVRMFAYTAVSFTILQYVGLFALAGIRGMYVTTDSKLNAFYPKTYVNVELEENDDGNHVYVLDDSGNAKTTSGNKKELKVKNPGTNKKDVLVRAKIVATIYNDSGVAIGETQNYQITGTGLTADITATDMWYHSNVNNGTYAGGTVDDEYFYYTSVLKKGDTTSNLFDNVTLTDIENIPDDGWVEFNIIVDTVEVGQTSDGKYDFTKAVSAWGETMVVTVLKTAQSSTTS